MRAILSGSAAVGFCVFVLSGGHVHAQKKLSDKARAARIHTLQTEYDKLTKRLAEIEAELAEMTRPEWTVDPKAMKIPDAPVAGKVLGEYFKPEKVNVLPSGALELEQGRSRIIIFLGIKAGQAVEGKSYEFTPDDKLDFRRPSVHVHIFRKTGPPRMHVGTNHFALRLEFGKQQETKVPGRLYFSLADGTSAIAGTFTIDFK